MAVDCDLCRLEIKTNVYFEDNVCIILDCISCKVPMVVWKHHGVGAGGPTEDEQIHMFDQLGKLGEGDFILDGTRRLIPDHWHAHLRSKDGSRPTIADAVVSRTGDSADSRRSLPHLGSVPIGDGEQEDTDNESGE